MNVFIRPIITRACPDGCGADHEANMGSAGQGRNGRSGFVVDGHLPTRAAPGVYPKSIKVGDVSTMDLAQADASTFADRRAAPRVRVDYPARLRTPFSDAVGHLC